MTALPRCILLVTSLRVASICCLTVCTPPGVLLRQLMHDQQLQGVSHVMVDEVHERSLDSDLLLLLLRDALLRQHARFKLVLMSATVDAELFAGYFGAMSPSVLHIQGRTFPVRDLYLEDALAAMMRDGHTLPPVGGGKHELDKVRIGLGVYWSVLHVPHNAFTLGNCGTPWA